MTLTSLEWVSWKRVKMVGMKGRSVRGGKTIIARSYDTDPPTRPKLCWLGSHDLKWDCS